MTHLTEGVESSTLQRVGGSMIPRTGVVLIVAAMSCWVGVLSAGAIDGRQRPAAPDATAGGLEVLQVRPNFYMIAGAGGNIGVQVGDDGAVVVDAGSAPMAAAALSEIRKISPRPIRYVIDTGPDPDHVGGNETMAKAGKTILNVNAAALAFTNGGGATIVATENVLARMSAPTGEASPFPVAAWPTETFFERRRYMYLNGEGIEILRQPAAHTDGDSIVFF